MEMPCYQQLKTLTDEKEKKEEEKRETLLKKRVNFSCPHFPLLKAAVDRILIRMYLCK